TNLYGPVPIVAAPLLKSAVVLPSAARFETMAINAKSTGKVGAGPFVLILIVRGSTTSVAAISLVYCANDEGLFGTFGARAMEKATSSAVKALPSWNVTLGRSLNSQVSLLTASHDAARPGFDWPRASGSTSASK